MPSRVLRLIGGTDESTLPARRLLRALGARHLLEVAVDAHGDARARKLGTAVDMLHALSDIAFASINARWRRAALTDAAITAGLVALGAIAAR